MSDAINAELQQLLNISVTHIRQQGCASFKFKGDDAVTCLYRSPDGVCCAAGPFVKTYKSSMEGETFVQLANRFGHDLEPLAVKHAEFVRFVLQKAHDEAALITRHKPANFLSEYESRLSTEVAAWNRRRRTQLVVPMPAPVVEASQTS